MKCEYGCGKEAKYQIGKNKKWCCEIHYNKCPSIRKKNMQGVKNAYKSGKLKSGKSRYKDLPEETKQRMNWSKDKVLFSKKEIFIENSRFNTQYVKRAILKLDLI